MTVYTVYYRKHNGLLWKKLKNIKGDGYIENPTTTIPVRFFIKDDETRYEFSAETHCFKFSKERFICIKENMEKESGQKLNVV